MIINIITGPTVYSWMLQLEKHHDMNAKNKIDVPQIGKLEFHYAWNVTLETCQVILEISFVILMALFLARLFIIN